MLRAALCVPGSALGSVALGAVRFYLKKTHKKPPPPPMTVPRRFPPPPEDSFWDIPAVLRPPGTRHARKVRRGALVVPAVVFGQGAPPISIDVPFGKINSILAMGDIFSRMFRISFCGHTGSTDPALQNVKPMEVFIKKIAPHPTRQDHFTHISFYRPPETGHFLLWVPIALVGAEKNPFMSNEDEHSEHLFIVQPRIPLYVTKYNYPTLINVSIADIGEREKVRIDELKPQILKQFPDVWFHQPPGTQYGCNYIVCGFRTTWIDKGPEVDEEAAAAEAAAAAAPPPPKNKLEADRLEAEKQKKEAKEKKKEEEDGGGGGGGGGKAAKKPAAKK
eukprot:gnl/Spiro4/18106_TR9673_c0_g1_i1.p1 gnl/Spiro4/18106_TR9673_c0_g1~~gnl/Spiro4/18106_TR9673_c0_g1_i1.p1  ORF type:complete len:334 (-),score=90.49 gnl/Spiro4/18106_TR9673_c0_g1_i1:79-1080(-)